MVTIARPPFANAAQHTSPSSRAPGTRTVGEVRRLHGVWLLRLVWLVLAGLVSQHAHAGMTCNSSNGNQSLAMGTVSVPTNLTAGMTVATLAPVTMQLNCHFISTLNPTQVTSATLTATFSTTASLAAGYTDVYQTGIAGLGVRYMFDSPACSTSNTAMSMSSIVLSCPFSGPVDGPYTSSAVTVTAILIATSAIAAGATTLATAPPIALNYKQSDQSGSWNQTPLYTGSASGVLVHETCTLNQSNVVVTLPPLSTSALASGVGAVGGTTPFSLSFTCAAGATVLMTLTDNVSPNNLGNTLQLTSDSTARAVGVQILNSSGTPVSYGPASATPGNTHQWQVGASPNGPLQVPLSAQYIRTTGTLTAGSVQAKATFTMSYQ